MGTHGQAVLTQGYNTEDENISPLQAPHQLLWMINMIGSPLSVKRLKRINTKHTYKCVQQHRGLPWGLLWLVIKVTGSEQSPGLCLFFAIIQRPPVDVISKPCGQKSQWSHQHHITTIVFKQRGGSALNTPWITGTFEHTSKEWR